MSTLFEAVENAIDMVKEIQNALWKLRGEMCSPPDPEHVLRPDPLDPNRYTYLNKADSELYARVKDRRDEDGRIIAQLWALVRKL